MTPTANGTLKAEYAAYCAEERARHYSPVSYEMWLEGTVNALQLDLANAKRALHLPDAYRTAHEVATLRGQLAAKERELEVARLAHRAADKDRQQALGLLDQAGVWTGTDLLVHDRVASLIRDWQEQQRKIVALQAEVGHLQTRQNETETKQK